jgi:hypothetical protein
MMNVFALRHDDGLLLWGRVSGTCDVRQCSQLIMLLEHQVLPPGSQVVLDFSGAEHIQYRAVPLLIRLGRRVENRRCQLRIAGMSDYMRRIVEFGGALEGREFIERHMWAGSLLPRPLGGKPVASRVRDPQDLLAKGVMLPSLN